MMSIGISLKTLATIVALLQVARLSETAETCIKCAGINCQRTNYQATEQCSNSMDVCVSVFNGSTLEAQGCLQQIAEELRSKCSDSVEDSDTESSEAVAKPQKECFKCLTDNCNSQGPEEHACVQCDSNTDKKCRTNPSTFTVSPCPLSNAMNGYCFVSDDGVRTIRGCSGSLIDQKQCLSSANCTLCSPSELVGCNRGADDVSGGDDGGSGSGSGDGGSGSGSGSGSGDGGSGSGSGSGSGDGGSGSGSGSGSGDGGSGSGSGSGSGDGGSGSGSGSGDGGSGSGSGSGDGGSGSGSGSGDGGSGSGSGDGGSGSGDGGSGSGDGGTGGNGGGGARNVHFNGFALIICLISTLFLKAM